MELGHPIGACVWCRDQTHSANHCSICTAPLLWHFDSEWARGAIEQQTGEPHCLFSAVCKSHHILLLLVGPNT